MKRFPNWPSLLDNYLRHCRTRRFRYGHWDCAIFAGDAVLAMTGTDIAADFRGRYKTRREALMAIATFSGESPTIQSVTELIADRYSMPEVSPGLAGRGDMVLIPRQHGRDHSLGILSMSGTHIIMALRVGYGLIPASTACRAWRV